MGNVAHPNHLPVAQHRHPVGDQEYLIQPVADIDHADPLGLQRAEGGKQPFHLIGGQAGGRFIQHQIVAIGSQRPGDGDQRFLGAAQVRYPRGGGEIGINPAQRLFCPRLGRCPVDPAAGAGIAQRQCDVFRRRHPVDQPKILMNKGNPLATGPPGFMGIGLAVDHHRAAIGAEQPTKDLDKRRFSRAVFTQQRHNLSRSHLQRHAFQRPRAAKRFGDAVEKQAVA